jgi:flagellar hook-associated protein 1 FlgK
MAVGNALNIALTGLKTTQAKLGVTAGNVSNADATGYSRRIMTTSTRVANNKVIGVAADSVTRQINELVQKQWRTSAADSAYASTMLDTASTIDSYLGAPGDESSLGTLYSKFTSSMQALATTPDSAANQTSALAAAQSLTNRITSLSDDIQTLRQTAETNIANAVDKVNGLLTKIAGLDSQVVDLKTSGASAADVEDQRDEAIDELSSYIDIQVMDQKNGAIAISTRNGTLLYDDSPVKLAFDEHGVITSDSAYSTDSTDRTVGTISIVSGPGKGMDLFANGCIRSGSIAAYKELRDETLVDAQSQLDSLAASLSMASGTNYEKGEYVEDDTLGNMYQIDVTHLTEGNTISVNYKDTDDTERTMSFVAYDSTKLADGDSPPTSSLSVSPTDTVYAVDISGGIESVGDQIQGYLSGYDATVTEVVDDKGTTTDTTDDVSHLYLRLKADDTLLGLTGTVSSGGLQTGEKALPLFVDGGSSKAYTGLLNGKDTINGLSGRLAVNANVVSDPAYLVNYDTDTPSGDGSRPKAILESLSSRGFYYSPDVGIGSSSAPYNGSVESFLNQVISTQGANAEIARQQSEGQDVVTSNLQTRYDNSRKVDLDTELSSLIQLQTAYSANARVMTVAKEMLDTLMNAM